RDTTVETVRAILFKNRVKFTCTFSRRGCSFPRKLRMLILPRHDIAHQYGNRVPRREEKVSGRKGEKRCQGTVSRWKRCQWNGVRYPFKGGLGCAGCFPIRIAQPPETPMAPNPTACFFGGHSGYYSQFFPALRVVKPLEVRVGRQHRPEATTPFPRTARRSVSRPRSKRA